jgi:hypothetical protein
MVLNFWALSRIISKAGFSGAWIVLPLSSIGLTIACFIVGFNDLRGTLTGISPGFFGSQVGLLWHLDEVTFFLNWVFFLVFAFIGWPSMGGAGSARAATATPANFAAAASPPLRKGPGGVTRDYGSATVSSGPTPAAPVVVAPTVKHCVWCAEALPGSRALFHDCGPKTRPPVFCSTCGGTLTEVGDCASCGVAR